MEILYGVSMRCCLWLSLAAIAGIATAQEPQPALDEKGHIVRFERDIAPILLQRCFECHSGEEAKADFRVDDREAVLAQLEPSDAESSSLYMDYLSGVDPDMLMPPPSHGGPLIPAEMALIRVWIEEGAVWPEEARVALPDAVAPGPVVQPAPKPGETLADRLWAFQGYFHPATVHFPIALLTIGGLFVILGLRWPKMGTQVPLACLILGSIFAVASSTMGWAFAYEKGYPGYQAGWSHDINSHRWAGTFVALASVILAIIAVIGVRSQRRSLNRVWKLGLFAMALTVGLVGHQGGELTYGKEFYPRAWQRLWGTEDRDTEAFLKTHTGGIAQPADAADDAEPEPESADDA